VSDVVDQANLEAYRRMAESDPVLVDVRPAGEIVPGMTPSTVLTSGAPLPWNEYTGGQRTAVLGGAVYEGLAADAEDAEDKIGAGEITVSTCHEHDCVGSVAGIYTASMPVFVVENRAAGTKGFCNFYEGPSHQRLNYGVYNDEVHQNLDMIRDHIAPVIADAVHALGGLPLRPLIRRAIHMGDELHSRNTAATLLLTRELTEAWVDVPESRRADVHRVLDFLRASDYFFLRLSMAAAKATANSAHGIEGSSVVTSMTLSCKEFAIRVSGLGERWFRGPHPELEGRLFEGYTLDDVEWIGGESHHAETTGLGGFVQAAAFALQAYQGGSPEAMVAMNRAMYDITMGEHPEYQIPYFAFRGAPLAIDVHKVVQTGIVPVIDGGLAGKGGGQIGAGILKAPMACFEAAARAHAEAYPRAATARG
jgi:Protein of unknown function (DUF1116)